MTIITYTMSDYDFLLGLARLCAGSAAGHISICRWINGDYGKDHYVFAGRLPPDLIHHIEGRYLTRQRRSGDPMAEFQCARSDVVCGPDVVIFWETIEPCKPARYRIDFLQFLYLCSKVVS